MNTNIIQDMANNNENDDDYEYLKLHQNIYWPKKIVINEKKNVKINRKKAMHKSTLVFIIQLYIQKFCGKIKLAAKN